MIEYFKNLKYKHKIYILSGILFIFLVVSYNMALKKTIILRRQCKEFKDKLENIQTAPQKIHSLKKEITYLDNIIGNTNDTVQMQEAILESITSYCGNNALTLKEFPKTHTITDEDYIVETCKLVVEGSFVNILNLVYLFETSYNVGKVVSVNFELTNLRARGRPRLESTVFIQNIRLIHHENI